MLFKNRGLRLNKFGLVILSGLALVRAVDSSAQGLSKPSSAEAQLTASLENSTLAYLDLTRYFWDPGERIFCRVLASPVAGGAAMDAWKGNWDTMSALLATNGGKRYSLQLTVKRPGATNAAWEQAIPIDPRALAEATRQMPPGEKLSQMRDVPARIAFEIPGGTLTTGEYLLLIGFVDPEGKTHAFPDGSTPESATHFFVRILDPAKISIQSHAKDAENLLTNAVEIGNPGRQQFPKDDANDCQARSVWSLRAFDHRVLVGYGDWDLNRGPIEVWSFGPKDIFQNEARILPPRFHFEAATNSGLSFVQEFVVQEESIEHFRAFGDRLMIPGIDGNKTYGPDGFLFGNLYIREKGFWRKLSTIPKARHVNDVAEWGGSLFVTEMSFATSSLLKSDDNGLTWQSAGEANGAGEMVPFGDSLLAFGEGSELFIYQAGKLEKVVNDLFPGSPVGRVYRSTPFAGSVVYTTFHTWGMSRETRHPLFSLRDARGGAQVVSLFRDKDVRDILVEGQTLYVLVNSSSTSDSTFAGEIYATTDLKSWNRVAAFKLPATPSAFTRLAGEFYVGTANRGYNAEEFDQNAGAVGYGYADKAAGGIFRIEK